MIPSLFRRRRRRKLTSRAFPEAWLEYLERNVPYHAVLSAPQQAKLRDALRIFLAERSWEGCGGLELSEEIQVTISALACTLVLGYEDFYFDELGSVLVYPGGYVVQGERRAEKQFLLGEAHAGGPVVVSWWQDGSSGRLRKISEVALHEFAHLLDMQTEEGLSPISGAAGLDRWRVVLREEYDRHVEADEDTPVLSSYGATDESEFLAVATESFFLRPLALRGERPSLYGVLCEWYRQDPARDAERARERGVVSDDVGAGESPGVDEDATLEDLDETIRRHPDLADAYRERAAILLDREDYRGAIADLDEVLRLAPDSVDAYAERGEAHLLLEDLERAIGDFSEAIRLAPGDSIAYHDRAIAYMEAGEDERALADLDEALRLDPENVEARETRACLHHDRGDYRRAIADCDEALRLAPDFADAYETRGLAHAALGDELRAAADEARASELRGGAPGAGD